MTADGDSELKNRLDDEYAPDTTWFREAGFGIFMHWGPYTATDGRWHGLEREKDLWGEWIRHRAEISKSDYEDVARRFAPTEFEPEDWAEVFKASGAKYVILTAKHHDGFCLYPSQVSAFNSVDWPEGFSRDLVHDLEDAVRAAGLRYGVYYSHKIDWYHNEGAKETFADYFENVCIPQVKELLEDYGPKDVMWFDMNIYEKKDAERLKKIVRQCQPNALISPRIGVEADFAGGGDNEVPPVPMPSPWESCMTLTHHWASYPQDVYHRSAEEVIRLLAEIRSKGGNMLLNIGPGSDGVLAPRDVLILRRVGAWLGRFGESIYGVGASPLPHVPWGWITAGNDGILYLHVLGLPVSGEIQLPGVIGTIECAWLLGDPEKTPIAVRTEGDRDHWITMPTASAPVDALDVADTVIAVKVDVGASYDPIRVVQDDVTNEFIPATASLLGGAEAKNERVVYTSEDDPAVEKARHDNIAALAGEMRLEWEFRTNRAADYHLVIDYADPADPPRSVNVAVDDKVFQASLSTTPEDKEHRFRTLRVGTVALRENGPHIVSVNVFGGGSDERPVIFHRLRLAPSRTTLLP